jgi:RNA polymerase sigma factor (sigma-70 family)
MEETGDRKLLNLFIRDAMKIPLMTREEENLEGRRAVAGDIAARNRLIAANLRFVLAVAFRYRNSGVPLLELLSAGCMGALIAANRYDPDVGVRFLTYAEYRIRERMQSTIARHREDPATVSLDDPVSVGAETTVKDLLVVDDRTFENALGDSDMDRLLNHPGVLTEQERHCLRLRYRDDMTLRQAGALLGVEKTRVATIETRALYKLRRFLAYSGTDEDKALIRKRTHFFNIIEERR